MPAPLLPMQSFWRLLTRMIFGRHPKSRCSCAPCRKVDLQQAWHIVGLRVSTRTVGYFLCITSLVQKVASSNAYAEGILSVMEVRCLYAAPHSNGPGNSILP